MSSQPTNAGPVPVPTGDAQSGAKKGRVKTKLKSKGKSKPARTLPTDRISVPKQLDILRAYAAASGNGARPATIGEVAGIVKMAPTTIAMANAFLSSVGLLKRADAGSYLPSTEVVSFLAAYEWDRKTASHKLGPRLKETWFAEALLPRISFDAVEEKIAINVLAEASAAGPDYEKELRMLVEFLAAGGVVQREAGQVKLMKPITPIDGAAVQSRTDEQRPADPDSKARVNTSYAAQSPGGGIDFNITVHVDMSEFGNWRPDRIEAFFHGIAAVLAAKAAVEKGGLGS